ncbi:MAG: apaH, partial [Gammaproteobacteria bacterium]|nr:apaH [Gammaproteobacteria bacterium]
DDTLQEILQAPDAKELIDWLRTRPLLHYDAKLNFLMVHAGIAPQWTLEQAQAYAHEVEAALQGDQVQDFLAHMYGNQPDIWQDSLAGWDRLRVITNYLTRLRFCNSNGQMDFKHKGDAAPEGFYPWFKVQRLSEHLRIVYGHWAALKGQADAENVFAIDTGCVWGGSLTALRLEDLKKFSVPAKKASEFH